MAHPELGTKILDQVLDVVGTYVKVETQARLEGRNMSMVLSPDKTALAVKPVDDAAVDAPAPNGDVAPTTTEPPVVTEAPAEAATVAAPAPASTPAAESPAPEPATATEQSTP
jgi:hypothetical protein